MRHRDEVDFLLEMENRLEADLATVRARLEIKLGADVTGRVIDRPNHLRLVKDEERE